MTNFTLNQKQWQGLFFSLFFTLAFLSTSCTKSEPSVDFPELDEYSEIQVLVPSTTSEVSINELSSISSSITASTTKGDGDSKEILNILPILSDQGDTLIYAVNYVDDAGFVFISATKNFHPIIMSSETGNYDPDSENNSSFDFILDSHKRVISNAINSPDSSQLLQYHLEWLKFAEKKSISINKSVAEVNQLVYNSMSEWYADGYEVIMLQNFLDSYLYSTALKEEVNQVTLMNANSSYDRMNYSFVLVKTVNSSSTTGPLLTTEWHQHAPFNNNMAFYSSNIRYYAGCVNIAVGQIMKYHTKPTSFDWDNIDTNGDDTKTANLISDIYIRTSSYSTSSSQETSSTANDALSALKYYGYSNAVLTDFTISRIKGQISFGQPVYHQGTNSSSGHAWVTDGYKETSSDYYFEVKVLENCPESYTPQTFTTHMSSITNQYLSQEIHINLGWTSNNLLWTIVDILQFPSANKIIYDIY